MYRRYGYGAGFALALLSGSAVVNPPVAVTNPTITGNVVEGQVLTLDAGNITGATAVQLVLERDGEPIEGVAGPTYQVRPGDVGSALLLRAYASNSGGTTLSSSAATATATAAPNALTYCSFDNVTFTGTTALTSVANYVPDLRSEGVGTIGIFGSGTGRINKGRLWASAGAVIYGFGPSRADGGMRHVMRCRTVVANQVMGVALRAQSGNPFNGYHVAYLRASNQWLLTNGNQTGLVATTGSFASIADTFPAGDERVILFDCIGTTITYTIINPATGAVLGSRTGTSALYAAGFATVRNLTATNSGEDTGITFERMAIYNASQAAYAVLDSGPANGNNQAASSAFRALIFGSLPPSAEVTATLSGSGVVTPATPLVFALEHPAHPSIWTASFTVTPSSDGSRVVGLSSLHLRPLMTMPYFSISLDPPALVAAYAAKRGALSAPNTGGVELNSLLLTAGFVADWTTTVVGANGGLDSHWSSQGPGQTKFPTPTVGTVLNTAWTYTFTFASTANPAITINVPVTIEANSVTVASPSDVLIAQGAVGANNTTLSNRIMKIATGATGFNAQKLYIDRHNASATNTNPLVITNEDNTRPANCAGIHVFQSNYVTLNGLASRLTRAQGSALGTNGIFFSGGGGVGCLIDGCSINGPALDTTQTPDGAVFTVGTTATIEMRNCRLRWVQNGVKTGAGAVGARIVSQIFESNDIRYFTSNGMILCGTTTLTRYAFNLWRSAMRDISNDSNPGKADHLDVVQLGDGTIHARLEIEANAVAPADGTAGLQIFFGGVEAQAGFCRNNVIFNASGAHSMTLPRPSNGFVIHCNTLLAQRYFNQANPLVFIDDTLKDGSVVTDTPGINVSSTTDATVVLRRNYAQNQISAGAATLSENLSYRVTGTNTLVPANNPATNFVNWDELLTYNWASDALNYAQAIAELRRLALPSPTGAVHRPDGRYVGAIANNGGVAVLNDEGVYA